MKTDPYPRILMITPEITYFPEKMGNFAHFFSAKAGGLADISAGLFQSLCKAGVDVHLAMPMYRSIFSARFPGYLKSLFPLINREMCGRNIHFVEDECFSNLMRVYTPDGLENTKLSLVFQKDVIGRIIPETSPDLIHCHDWISSMVPAMAKAAGIPCLLTVHNIHTVKSTLSFMESFGLDPRPFWRHLYFERMPENYAESRDTNRVEYLTSGIFAADFVNTVSTTFLKEIIEGTHDFVEKTISHELKSKWDRGRAVGILNAPDPSFDPAVDRHLFRNYTSNDHAAGKRDNKRAIQMALGLEENLSAPLLFWPSRLDPVQKGCDLMVRLLGKVVAAYWNEGLQILFVADGGFQSRFKDIVRRRGLEKRVSVRDFDENLTRLAYGAADFILMPSRYEPCGLPQMIGAIYGALPIAYDTGGIHDTIEPLSVPKNAGNGFLFQSYDPEGFFNAIGQALTFFSLPPKVKHPQIERIMKESRAAFNHETMSRSYIDLYEKVLGRKII